MEIKVVTGANLGDEGKGLTSYCLAKEAVEKGNKVLTVLFNGGAQRGHTAGGKVFHCSGTGALVGSDTFYHSKFLLDPITLWLTQERVIISPDCRVILPCDVVKNRNIEINRGSERHGSCGMGIFEASKRSKEKEFVLHASDLCDPWKLYPQVKTILQYFNTKEDELYNLDNWMRAVDWVRSNCIISYFEDIVNNYDTIIYEGGQGLLLDQSLIGFTKHLTPSSVGSYNIAEEINALNCKTDVFYVSRTYMTRHGRGPMEAECDKENINPDIVDRTNQYNDWQEGLRFGYLNQYSLAHRAEHDFARYKNADAHIIYTQLNYTDGLIAAKNGKEAIVKPKFVTDIYGSWKEDTMSKLDI